VKIVDLTLPLSDRIPSWPDSSGFKLIWTKTIEKGSDNNNSQFICDSHAGTHIDAPYHFIDNGKSVDQIPVDTLVGSCRVISMLDVPCIDVDALEALQLKDDIQRLLFKTENSKQWLTGHAHFKENYVYLTESAARWLAAREFLLVGIDYLSIGSYRDGISVHQCLLEAGIVIIEGLNLSMVEEGEYELICLPLKTEGAEAAPVRAILRSA